MIHPATLTLTLPLPRHDLSLNGRLNWRAQRRGQHDQAEVAGFTALAALIDAPRPHFPAGLRLRVLIDVERRKRGNVWDTPAIIEATKGYLDGLQGLAYADDRQVRGIDVRWDATPTGRGLIHLHIGVYGDRVAWPAVDWATETQE